MRLSSLLASLILACLPLVLRAQTHSSQEHKFRYEVLTQQQDVIWGFDFLADGRILFTERQGRMAILDPRRKGVFPVKGVPSVWAKGQGGLLDVRVHPQKKNEIYFTYSMPAGKGATTAVGKATLEGTELKNVQTIFKAHEANTNNIHFGSRIEFGKDGKIYFAVGDRNERDQVQDLGYHIGKVIRINEDGSAPADNPFINTKGARPEIWALGVRSPQGLNFHPETGDLWESEMGPRGGDELNIIKKGLNYGWPVVTYGREYWGPKIGEGTSKAGMEQPVIHWVPSISPSAMTFYTGTSFPKWKGNIFLANLSGQHVRRLILANNKVVGQEELLKNEGTRFRNIRTGPEGFLYVSSDDGKIARLVPAN